jgi:hypothetical protein
MDDVTRRDAMLKAAVAGVACAAGVAGAAINAEATPAAARLGEGACEESGCDCDRWRGNLRNVELDFCATPGCGHSKQKHG